MENQYIECPNHRLELIQMKATPSFCAGSLLLGWSKAELCFVSGGTIVGRLSKLTEEEAKELAFKFDTKGPTLFAYYANNNPMEGTFSAKESIESFAVLKGIPQKEWREIYIVKTPKR